MRGWEGHRKCVQLRIRRRCVTSHVYVCTYTYLLTHLHISFHVLAAFLSYSILFYLQKFNLSFIQKGWVRQKGLFFSNKINFCCHGMSFFYLKLYFRSKLAKMLLILIKQNLRYSLYFSMISYFEKNLCSKAQKIRYTLFFCFILQVI